MEASPFEGASSIHWMGDRVIAHHMLFSKVYAPEDVRVDEAPASGWRVRTTDDEVRWTDAPDPRAALTESMVRRDVDETCATLQALTGLPSIHPSVKEWMSELLGGGLDRGPLDFTPWEQLPKGCHLYRRLFRFDLGERYFPALPVAGESGGVEFWLMLETGMIVDLHHDASFFEEAAEVWEGCNGDVRAFEETFPERGNGLTIRQLMHLQKAFPDTNDLRNLEDLEPASTFRALCEAFGWELVDLGARIGDFEYFLGLQETHGSILDAMIDEA